MEHRNIFTDEDFLPSSVTDRPQPNMEHQEEPSLDAEVAHHPEKQPNVQNSSNSFLPSSVTDRPQPNMEHQEEPSLDAEVAGTSRRTITRC
ncbi:hypothetical protein QE152_g15665 [Popillia japonica]|uniref:Uncharacterized protein n=1 Tax=Popillia japonica TaxID=7064 RepID=A0AAW1L882_POPJA